MKCFANVGNVLDIGYRVHISWCFFILDSECRAIYQGYV